MARFPRVRSLTLDDSRKPLTRSTPDELLHMTPRQVVGPQVHADKSSDKTIRLFERRLEARGCLPYQRPRLSVTAMVEGWSPSPAECCRWRRRQLDGQGDGVAGYKGCQGEAVGSKVHPKGSYERRRVYE